jgi:hypothetical protein
MNHKVGIRSRIDMKLLEQASDRNLSSLIRNHMYYFRQESSPHTETNCTLSPRQKTANNEEDS